MKKIIIKDLTSEDLVDLTPTEQAQLKGGSTPPPAGMTTNKILGTGQAGGPATS